jgi:hypothetical protein
MELYNFFTEVVKDSDTEKVEELRLCLEELKPICLNVQLCFLDGYGHSIIGQMHGGDTNIGDLDLLVIFGESDIEYTWFDSITPSVNNLKKC